MPTVSRSAFARESAGLHRALPTSAPDLFKAGICRILVAVLTDVRQARRIGCADDLPPGRKVQRLHGFVIHAWPCRMPALTARALPTRSGTNKVENLTRGDNDAHEPVLR